MMTFRSKNPFGWADFWAAVLIGMMFWAVSDAYAHGSWHAWRMLEFEYVYDAYERPIKRCVWECTTDYNQPHYTTTRSHAYGSNCPMPY
jgi:hypothetical protein